MLNKKIHNVRFYNLEPKSVICLSYEPKTKKIALSRSDNSLEIWNTENAPFLEYAIVNVPKNCLEAISWVNLRLFSCGISGTVVEYNLSSLTIKSEIPVIGGAAWCLDVDQNKKHIAVGTEDGYVNIFLVNTKFLVHEKIFDKQKGRILCIKWDNSNNLICTGSTDTIRIWNVSSGHAIHKMTTRKDMKKDIIIWCLAVTADNMIVSGDSEGTLCIWDIINGILVESHDCHSADILAVTLSSDMNTIYCAGVDPIIRTFSRVTVKSNGRSQWVRGIERKLHTHDVRALIETNGKLYSAGVDGYLAQSSYPPRILVKYPPLLQQPCVSVCHESKCLMLRYRNLLEVWQLGSLSNNCQKEPLKLLQLKTKNGNNIISCAISNDSKLIVYSTSSQLSVFSFDIVNGNPVLSKIDSDIRTKEVYKMLFAPNDKFLVTVAKIDGGNTITLYTINVKHIKFYRTLKTIQQLTATIGQIIFSPDNKYIVCSDLNSHICIYNIDKCDRFESCEHWSLPKYHCPPTAMAVQRKTSNLVIVYADHKIMEYNILKKYYTEFSRNIQKHLPNHWLTRPFPINKIIFDSDNENIIILHDDTTVFLIDKTMDFEKLRYKISKLDTRNIGSDNGNDFDDNGLSSQQVIRVIKKYKHLVYLDWIDQSNLVAVEVNPTSLTAKLPPRLKKKHFAS